MGGVLLVALIAPSTYYDRSSDAREKASTAPSQTEPARQRQKHEAVDLPRVHLHEMRGRDDPSDVELTTSRRNPFVFPTSPRISSSPPEMALGAFKPTPTVEYQGCLVSQGKRLALIKMNEEPQLLEEGAILSSELTLVQIDPAEVVVKDVEGGLRTYETGSEIALVATHPVPSEDAGPGWVGGAERLLSRSENPSAVSIPTPEQAESQPGLPPAGAQTSVEIGYDPQSPIAPAGQITAEPTSVMTAVGSQFSIVLSMSRVENIGSLNMTLTYSPATFAIVDSDIREGDFMTQGGARTSFFKVINREGGSITIGISRNGLPGGASGSGKLVTVGFIALAEGSGTISIGNTTLITDTGRLIPVDATPSVYVEVSAAD